MRILYFYQYFTTPKGCWSTRAYEFARRWAEAGDQVTVITSVYDKSDLRPDKFISRHDIDGIDVRVINVRLSNKHAVAWRILTFALYSLIACWYALTLKADVVLTSSGPITVGLPGLVAHYLRRRPLVFEVRDLWPEGSIQMGILHNKIAIALAKFFERRCYKAASKIVALSDGMAEWITEHYGFKHIEVIPNASDNELFGSNGQPFDLPAWAESKSLILYTGTLGLIDDCRQILDMAECLQGLGGEEIKVVVIGDGRERHQLEADARMLGLDNIHFLGMLPKTQVASWLHRAACSLLVVRTLPFLETASPNKIFDAFAAGVPVIQTTQGWIKRLLDREQCGITVRPNDPGAMAEGVRLLTRDVELRTRLSRNARRVAREIFDRTILATRMREILREAAGLMTTRKRVLVTGGTGFLGQHLIRHLEVEGADVLALCRHPVEGVRSIAADLSSPELDFGADEFSVVYHLAGLAHRVPRTPEEENAFFRVNVEGTRNLLRALERTERLPESVALVSSIAVYGQEEGALLDEGTPRRAKDPYGASKREAEDVLLEWSTRCGVRAAIIRPPLIVGRNAPGNFGMMVAALRSGRYLGIGAGAARRSMVLAEDVARILPAAALAGGIFNLTDGYNPSFAELESAICATLRRPAPRRVPFVLAKLLASAGDFGQKLTGRNLPFSSRTLMKMTSTLTLSDRRGREALGWNPTPVLNRIPELVQ